MSQAEVDQVKLVAWLHDVGMRLLDYDSLYRKRNLAPEEMALLREHTAVGAAIVEPLLGGEIARGVLCHHERWDGRGYPNELHGEEIPRLSRVVQVCDVYETMVAPDNRYQPAVSQEQALSMIAQNAGSQFDPEVAHRFLEMMR
jgi:HD-GYP domain-containing protein (c-di-GMP phosphodiesterase class II)